MNEASYGPVPDGIGVPKRCRYVKSALCRGCGAHLATFGWTVDRFRARDLFISAALVRRPQPYAAGVPRFGPQRSDGARHERVMMHPAAVRMERDLDPFYVNCPRCDRGQMVNIGAVLDEAGDAVLASGETADTR